MKSDAQKFPKHTKDKSVGVLNQLNYNLYQFYTENIDALK